MKKDINEICKTLSNSLIDDFRGFLVYGTDPLEIPDNKLHALVAIEELKDVPNWNYESGTGQNPIVDLMKEKSAIYITRIPIPKSNNEFQRTVGYLTDAYSEIIEYKGVKKPAYEIIKKIALGMGYDVDEYTLQKNSKDNYPNPVDIVNYKANMVIKKQKTTRPNRTIKPGDKPIFAHNGNLIGFISNGKFVSKENYSRYISSNNISPSVPYKE